MMAKKEQVREFVEQAVEKGYVSEEELLELFPEPEETVEELDALLAELGEHEVTNIMEEPPSETLVEEDEGDEIALQSADMDDPIGTYLAEMGDVPLLTHEEEIDLAERVRRGRRARVALSGKSKAEQREQLQRQAEEGQEARDRLATSNLRLVISIAKNYIGQGLPFVDLVQEGNVGLMRAIDRYDPDKGTRFSTYATWWIRQAILRALDNHSRTIRIPSHTIGLLRQIRKTTERMAHDQGKQPELAAVAAEVGMPLEMLERLLRASRQTVSLQTPMGEDNETELGDLIVDQQAELPYETIEHEALARTLEAAMHLLSPREATIVRLHYGLRDGVPHTLKQIGNRLGISRERVRQLEVQAFQKIRAWDQFRSLVDFMAAA